jgi:hypothetical protein
MPAEIDRERIQLAEPCGCEQIESKSTVSFKKNGIKPEQNTFNTFVWVHVLLLLCVLFALCFEASDPSPASLFLGRGTEETVFRL